MRIGSLVKFKNIVGIVISVPYVNTISVYFPSLNQRMTVFAEDMEVLCK
jgi:hypothetical protein